MRIHITPLLLFILTFFIISCQFENRSEPGTPTLSESIVTPEWYRDKNPDAIKVVTWNIEHFVDSYDNPYIDNRREDNPPVNIEVRRELLAKAIRALDADLVVFQELESDSYIQEIAGKHFPEMGYEVFAALESPDWYMNVVLMSRIPLGMFYSYAHINTPIIGETDSLGNPQSQTFINNRMWTAEVLVSPEYRFTLTGLHLKAGRGARNEGWRMGQINLLRDHLELMSSNDPQINMLIAGDLNTTPGSEEFNTLLGTDTGLHFIDPLAGTGEFSHPSDSLFWRIDHILPNGNMSSELVPMSASVARPLSMQEMIQISDHMPVTATFVTVDK